MNEGKLKQRIHENHDVIPSTVMIFLQTLLDEAKQVYHYGAPIIAFDIPDVETRKKVDDAFRLLEKVIADKDKWFLKYFGEKTNE